MIRYSTREDAKEAAGEDGVFKLRHILISYITRVFSIFHKKEREKRDNI